jgi:hypothetical protein
MTLSAFGILSLPLSLFSQAAPPPLQLQPGPDVSAWLDELKRLQARLDPIEQQALADPGLQLQQQELGNEILAAMVRSDSSVARKLDRLQAIVVEIHQLNGDDTRMQALAEEVLQIKPSIEDAQARAMQEPEIDAHIKLFRASLYDRMQQIDPEARDLIVRYQALERLLQAALEEAQSAPAQPSPALVRPWIQVRS